MTEQPPLWERQSWDTAASLERFRQYYLPQETPRSLNEAYRRYRSDQGQKEARGIEAPGSWRRWFRGLDGQGRPLPGAVGWDARAKAWDDHQAALDAERWAARRTQIREADWQAGEALRALAAQMLAQTPQFLKTTRRLVKGQNGAADREVVTLALDQATLFKAVELASKLQRQAAELVEVQRLEHTGQGGGPITTGGVTIYLPDNGREAGSSDSENGGDDA